MTIAIIALALGAANTLPSPETPIFCVGYANETAPLGSITFSQLTQAFMREFGLSPIYAAFSEYAGILRFKSSSKSADTISFEINTVEGGGIALDSMRVRMKGKREVLTGNQMCWRTFSIVHAE